MRTTTVLRAAGAACALTFAPHADAQILVEDVYVGSFTRSGNDNLYISDSDNNIIRRRQVITAILGLYAPFEQNADEIGGALASAGPLRFGFGSDDPTDFGSIGDDVNFNPLATGGTVDIATGGDYIDPQLVNGEGAAFSVTFARVDVENEVFRQEFGPVQGQRRDSRGSTSFSLEWRALNAWDQEFFATDEQGRTPEYRLSFSIVPAPGAMTLVGVGAMVGVRRRRERTEHPTVS